MEVCRAKSRGLGLVLFGVFLLALLPRLIYPVSRPMQWYERSVDFWDALLEGDWQRTLQRRHPGVMTMWIAGAGLRSYALVHGWSTDDLLDPPRRSGEAAHYPIEVGVGALSLAIAACIILACVLLAKLTDRATALVAGCLLALDPFYIAESKVLHVDALLATLMLVSALLQLCYLKRRKRRYLLLGGVFAGHASLSKSPAAFLIPFAGLTLVVYHLLGMNEKPILGRLSGTRLWGKRLWGVIRDLGWWSLAAVCIYVLLWPAMWVIPGEALSTVVHGTAVHVETVHPHPDFFAGQVIYDDLGPFYYVAILAWKATLVTLPAGCLAVVLSFRHLKRWREHATIWGMLLYGIGFLVMMALAAKKRARYITPVSPALDVLAAGAIVHTARTMGRMKWFRRLPWMPGMIIVVVLIAQAGMVLRHHPYYGTHYNLLMGGTRRAQHILSLGEQGEGLDQAARCLNSYPRAESMVVGMQARCRTQFRRDFVGHVRNVEGSEVDYWVFAINPVQRMLNVDLWEETWDRCQRLGALWSTSFDGVPYVWICPAYPYSLDTSEFEHRADVQLGEHIQLLGYRVEPDDLGEQGALTITLL